MMAFLGLVLILIVLTNTNFGKNLCYSEAKKSKKSIVVLRFIIQINPEKFLSGIEFS